MSFEKNLKALLEKIDEAARLAGRPSDEIKLVAVTKGRSLEEIQEAYSCGLRDFGENRVDEALQKREQLPSDIRWHFIGKLQKNKVNKVIGKFALIHSIDSVELAEKISRTSIQQGLKTAVLLEVNTSREATKSGLSSEAWKMRYLELQRLHGIEIHGLMAMAPLTEDESAIRSCFKELRLLGQTLQEESGDLATLSMGMSHDFPIAIQEGATLLRIGTALFMPQ
jgi:pyridoxal phosphate enzyme (YggS family)